MPFTLLPDDEAPQRGFRLLDEPKDPKIGQPEDLTFAEKYVAPVLEKLGSAVQSDPGVVGAAARAVLNNGNARGAALGRAFQGAADPGAALAQIAANASGHGESFNRLVADKEREYQAARAEAGSEGFDPLRAGGELGISLLGPGATTGMTTIPKAILTGGAYGALRPVTEGDDFWKQKAKDVAAGAATGAVVAPFMNAIARVVSPNASTNPALKLLREEGVTPSVGQTLGGVANALEEKAQSLPIAGSFIQNARQRGSEQLESAAYRRAAEPIGATIDARGNQGIAELSGKLGAEYDRVLPKLSVNVLDPEFVNRIGSLRALVQTLPQKEAQQFDDVLAREIDGRVLPNGTLSGQGLKDAWNALRDKAAMFSRSNDAYQAQLGQAFKQTFQELKDHVSATNAPADVLALKNVDFGYANFKRLQRAASSLGADEGRFSPAQLQSAVKAMDRSKDKARFAEGDALMQDLSAAGKKILTNKVPDSGTAGRTMLGGLILSSPFAPHITVPAAAGLAAGGAAYTAPVQNFLRALILRRPDEAPAVANYLRQLVGPATVAAAPMVEQGFR